MKTIEATKYENWVIPVRLTMKLTEEQWDKAVKESGLTDDDDVAFYVIEKFEGNDFDVSDADYYSALEHAYQGSIELDNAGYDYIEIENEAA